jgi:hypothetical protein
MIPSAWGTIASRPVRPGARAQSAVRQATGPTLPASSVWAHIRARRRSSRWRSPRPVPSRALDGRRSTASSNRPKCIMHLRAVDLHPRRDPRRAAGPSRGAVGAVERVERVDQPASATVERPGVGEALPFGRGHAECPWPAVPRPRSRLRQHRAGPAGAARPRGSVNPPAIRLGPLLRRTGGRSGRAPTAPRSSRPAWCSTRPCCSRTRPSIEPLQLPASPSRMSSASSRAPASANTMAAVIETELAVVGSHPPLRTTSTASRIASPASPTRPSSRSERPRACRSSARSAGNIEVRILERQSRSLPGDVGRLLDEPVPGLLVEIIGLRPVHRVTCSHGMEHESNERDTRPSRRRRGTRGSSSGRRATAGRSPTGRTRCWSDAARSR